MRRTLAATPDVGPVIAAYKQRASVSFVNAAVDLAIAKQWLRFDGTTYTLTEAGTALGRQSRMRSEDEAR